MDTKKGCPKKATFQRYLPHCGYPPCGFFIVDLALGCALPKRL